ncbi:hypothetical protein OE88DRAFT_1730270 [Heliocybe sulcata]|uniref:Mitochondrial inner membrane protease ATP23 n=1 Tax=Heliocybe sulcata TaxID=5364 RepID=A0A5C3NK22_9AGAM|nr:hypothetical protein OE88DRAFT_1730270 [Heliocybe sulcata]
MASSASPAQGSQTPSEKGLYERWRRTFSSMTGAGLTPEEQEAEVEGRNHRTCEQWKAQMMEYSPAVTFMLKHLELSGCPVKPSNIECGRCDWTRSGGFMPEGKIVLCQGRIFNKSHMEHTLTHELVHMYDQCKFKVDWLNLRHHACSEIRANSLGGDCKWAREIQRGFLSISKQHQECVRRRAVLSVKGNPACPDEAAAERAVNEVWESCFSDTRPFDEIY